MRLFIWQQCINMIWFPWESVLIQVVFCCFFPPACYSFNLQAWELFLFLLLTSACLVYNSFRKHEVLKFQTEENASVALCLWRDEFRLWVPCANGWFVVEWELLAWLVFIFAVQRAKYLPVLLCRSVAAWRGMFVVILWMNLSDWCHTNPCGSRRFPQY